ncbi:uncharacterized protein (DUF2252 family) [Rhodanobacter sp. ANJX3]|uniref:DUF2252 domain-containing protein n=1 Tax=Rhodanobacter sp. ANJX3 TaxID=2723083 RepID=UPI00161064F6|nr:DUF2252 family protein [Rhodanobacter sp. ANJX3]MBB5358157.1 uncharacterized protein (DUF2252 family) [Rhodanobacter sp. ANJX3]
MMIKLKRLIGTLAVAMLLGTGAQAATSRPSFVVNDIYNYNHPYAATDSGDLATKMQLMSSSAFSFYRGTADIFYRDTATLPASSFTSSATGFTWIGGDAHLSNVGAQRDSSGMAAFSTDDFDEGYLGQYVWDLRRAAVSMVLAGRENGLSDSQITTGINAFVAAYVTQINSFAKGNGEASFQLTTGNTSSVVKDTISDADDGSRSDLLSKYTTSKNGVRTFQNAADLVAVSSATYTAISNAIGSYIQTISSSKRYAAGYYAIKDIHQKLGSGTGSLGRLRYYVLIEGPSTSTSDDVILEMKQEASSDVALAAPGQLPASVYGSNEGERVALTNKAQLLNTDVLVGYTTIDGAPYYVHEKSPYEEDFDYTQLTSSSKFTTAMTYIGRALASAHALADKDYNPAIVPYDIDAQISAVADSSGLQTEISSFAFSYADQVNLDWQAFVSAYKAGTPLY